MTGTTIAQAIPVGISPILTRLYSPHDFGVFALFGSVTVIFGAVANGRYELAIMLPRDDDDALNIAALGLGIAAALAFALLFVVILFNSQIALTLGSEDVGPWLYVTPFAVLLLGLHNVLTYYNARQKHYQDIARSNVIKALVLAVVQLAMGLAKAGAAGLISGQVVSNLAANVKLFRNTIAGKDVKRVIGATSIRRNARLYKDFPLFSLWGVLANTLSVNLVNVLISRFYVVSTLGQYALVYRAMALPASLIGNAIGQVFFQQASEQRRVKGSAMGVFVTTFRRLVAIGAPLYAVAYFVVEDLFVIVFGEEWRPAGRYAKILVPLFAIRFVVSPLSLINQVYMQNRLGMYANFILLGISVGVLLVGGHLAMPFQNVLQILTLTLCIFYSCFLVVVYYFVKQDDSSC